MSAVIPTYDINDSEFEQKLAQLLLRDASADSDDAKAVDQIAADIIRDVCERGDQAVLEYTQRFDQVVAQSFDELVVSEEALAAALENITPAQRSALETAAARIRSYHEKQKQESWHYTDDIGVRLGQQITAIEKVGIYVPGGKASYPSSVLMNAVPAVVAGVEEIWMVVPTPGDVINPMVLAAAHIAGVKKVVRIGGAQAIAALAYGTESISRVDKIVGPGNRFVASAKKQVFGRVAIDMIAGPSEILIYCDGNTNADWIAMDLCSQAEHDEVAQSILIARDREFLKQVEISLEKLVPTLSRADIVKASLKNRGALIAVNKESEAVELINRIAPEHLELSIENPAAVLSNVRHAGAIFMGRYTSEALGDYCVGTNHVLPTSGTARFSSPLGVYDFQKRTSVIECNRESANILGEIADELAQSETLDAHARSARYRVEDRQD